MGLWKGPGSLLMCFLLIISLALNMAGVSDAQDSPQDFVSAHNAARSQVGVPLLAWDDGVAAYARNYSSQRKGDCKLMHSGGPYGENLAWGKPDLSGVAAVKLWADEKSYYDHNSNSCVGGRQCGHYTQLVWRSSLRLGCAKVRCDNNGGTFISCNYAPPGNIQGQKPY